MTRTVLFAAILAGTVSAASAQVATVPNPANPTPAYPIATDGTPLPPLDARAYQTKPATEHFLSLFSGRPTDVAGRAR